MKETTVMHHYHHPHPNHRLLTVISAIVLLTIVHDVKGSGLFDDDITTRTTAPTTTSGSVSSFQVSWLALSSVFMIVLGLINSYTERSIF
uniref:MEG-32.2 protein n=1 Tax=Schistosoma mansoni TaxID=6183 RepID=A0A0U5KJ28_SCHMA|nr:TPA: MEG-32.2 protein [Schistosoma mansoni]